MLGYTSAPVPFTNKGLVQREDPSLLQPGEYSYLENIWSKQEGNLTTRTGHKRLNAAAFTSAAKSISKLNLGGADSANPRYVGTGTTIQRSNSSYAFTDVFTGLTDGARWSAEQYNAGTTGKPQIYFATKNNAVRDNAALYSTLQNWGVDPPAIPVTASLQVPYTASLVFTPSSLFDRFIPSTNSDGSGFKTVSAINGVAASVSAGYVQITPTAGGTINGVNGIYVGQQLLVTDAISGNESIIVLAVTPSTFYCITTKAHSAVNVTLNCKDNVFTSTIGSGAYYATGFTIDASFNGVPEDGYETDDAFHIALACDDVTNVSQIQIAIVPNYTTVPTPFALDYYFYSIVPASLMVSSRAATAPNYSDFTNWIELNIPKTAFTKIGNAGSGAYTWKNINQVYIVAVSSVATAHLGISNMYFIGGGGLNSSAAGTSGYDWLYTYRNPLTGYESNPCVAMAEPNLLPPVLNGKANITVTGISSTTSSGNADISGPGSIAIYRRGGTFADGLYRRVGLTSNPGAGSTAVFVDNASDASLNQASTIEFDNDPPVRSTLPVPLTGQMLTFNGSAASTANTATRVTLANLPTGFDATATANVIIPGSTITMGTGTNSETCIVSAAGYDGSHAYVDVYLQFVHNAYSAGVYPSETVECDSVNRGAVAGRCYLVHQDFDCLFVAGDSNNPATLSQSKVGQPESFPVINLEDGFAHQVNVGSPANPIYGITSLNGELICLNYDNIFIVQIWQGQMQQPQRSLSSRGLYRPFCWCKGENRIWFLSYDGIYAWSGGESQKITEGIDYLFRNLTVNGIKPIDMTQASLFSMEFARGQLFFVYIDTAGSYFRLRFEVAAARWHMESILDFNVDPAVRYPITAAFSEPDTGNLLFGVTATGGSYLWLADFYSTSDGWVTLPTDGLTVTYSFRRDWPLGDPGTDYQVGEIMLELANAQDAVAAFLYYNYSDTATETLTIPAGTAPTRARYISTVNSGTPQTAYSIGLALFGASGQHAALTTFYTFLWRELKLEDVTTGPTTDWDNLGTPYDKYLWDLSMQYDTGGASIPVVLDTVNGIQGNTENLAVASYTLSGSQRSQQVFIVPDQTIAKLIRLRPVYSSSLTQFKFWQYEFRKDILPPDSINATPWDAFGYGCEKTFKSLNIQVDTGGIAASVAMQLDGSTVHTFSITGTFNNRASIITLPSNLIGKEFRMVPTPGTGGKFQLYGVQPYFEKEPCAITHWDSLIQVLGSAGFKFIKQFWVDFVSAGNVTFSIYRDSGTLFYQVTLPAQTIRAVARFYLPAVGVAGAFNKSKTYRFVLDAADGATTFKMYQDGSRVETRSLDGDQRAGYEQHILWEHMPLVA